MEENPYKSPCEVSSEVPVETERISLGDAFSDLARLGEKAGSVLLFLAMMFSPIGTAQAFGIMKRLGFWRDPGTAVHRVEDHG